MAQDPTQLSPMFRIDVSPEPSTAAATPKSTDKEQLMLAFMRRMVALQEKQNELLDILVQHTAGLQKQRSLELQQWKDANPRLARSCRRAAEALSKIQVQFLDNLTQEVAENEESLNDADFMFSDFVDRYGPRLAHLNGVIQVLAQLGHGTPVTGG